MSVVQVYLGIGSNIDARQNIKKALKLLVDHMGSLQESPTYQNPADGFDGDDFLNLVVSFKYTSGMPELMERLKNMEQQCGRQRQLEAGKGSRTIDLDLLTFGDLQGIHHDVELPRPDIFERQFVWQPFMDLLLRKDSLSPFEASIKSNIESLARASDSTLMKVV